jgi:hypothetical protein
MCEYFNSRINSINSRNVLFYLYLEKERGTLICIREIKTQLIISEIAIFISLIEECSSEMSLNEEEPRPRHSSGG